MQQLLHHAAILAQQAQDRTTARLGHALDAPLGLRGVKVEQHGLEAQHDKAKEQQPSHGGHQPIASDEPPADGREKGGRHAKDRHPGPDVHHVALLGVLQHQAGPRGVRDAPQPVHQGRDDEIGDVLGSRPDQAGHAKGDQIAEQQGEPAPVLVHQGAAHQRGKDLRGEPQAGDGADLRIGDAQGQHVDRHEGSKEIVRQAKDRLCQHAGAGIALELAQALDKRVLG